MHLYLATDLRDAPGQSDADELLESMWVTLDEALSAIDEGRIRDAKTIVGVEWLARRLRSRAA
jgi:ADP-ribose pyrophosphatase